MLIDIDGLSEEWIAESSTDSTTTPFSIQRLNNPGTLGTMARRYLYRNGAGTDCVRSFDDNEDIDKVSDPQGPDENGYIRLSDLSMTDF